MLVTELQELQEFWRFGTKIIGVGKNYRDHVMEMKSTMPRQPVIFLKPMSSIVREPGSIELPWSSSEVHHEVEVGMVIKKDGKNIDARNVWEHVGGWVLALDMTSRSHQAEAKRLGLPWTTAKGFDTFAPISQFVPMSRIERNPRLTFSLEVNGVKRQFGDTNEMIFKFHELVQYISRVMTLKRGDLILTGTPSGVGPVKSGDVLTGALHKYLESKPEVTFKFPVMDRKFE